MKRSPLTLCSSCLSLRHSPGRSGTGAISALAAVAVLTAQIAGVSGARADERSLERVGAEGARLESGRLAKARFEDGRRENAGLETMPSQAGDPSDRVWKDREGNPLPFRTDEEIIAFMQVADIESVDDLEVGITNPRRVVMVKEGVRMRAALRDFDQEYEQVRFNRQFFWKIRDSYLFDIPAYEVARMLELNNVPPVTLRRVNGVGASLQIWVEGALVESERLDKKVDPPEAESQSFFRQYQMVRVFDTLIGNVDRNIGNILFDDQWNFWLIDHSRAFVPDDTSVPYLEAIEQCQRSVFEELKSLEREELVARLSPPLQPSDIGWILRRRDKIVARLEALIVERGEDQVLFEAVRDQR